jgi:cation:H+ antiporter
MLIIILKLVAGFILLLAGGEFLVRGSVSIATKLNMSKLLIGLTIVALGTSAPELLVSVTAALKGNSVISLGNVWF